MFKSEETLERDVVETAKSLLMSVGGLTESEIDKMMVAQSGHPAPILSLPPPKRPRQATCLPTKETCWDYPVFTRIAFPLLCVVALPFLWYSQHHNILVIGIEVNAWIFTIFSKADVKSESVWSTVTGLWNMQHKEWPMIVLIFGWSICYPWVKYGTCLILWFTAGPLSKTKRGSKCLDGILAVVHWLGKWSYADLFIMMQMLGTLGGSLKPTSMVDVELKVNGRITSNMLLFVLIVGLSIFLIWYLRWSRQKPELALKDPEQSISLFTYTWQQREWKMVLLNCFLFLAMIWLWILSFLVDFAYYNVDCQDWQLHIHNQWNMASFHNALASGKNHGVYWVFFFTCIFFPTANMVVCLLLWFWPMKPGSHSRIRIIHSWMQMFSCIDVFLATFAATLYSDHGFFSLLAKQIPGGSKFLPTGLSMSGGLLRRGIFYPIFAAVLLLWFRHYIGQQLRRRLETPPAKRLNGPTPGGVVLAEIPTEQLRKELKARERGNGFWDVETPGGPDPAGQMTPGGPDPVEKSGNLDLIEERRITLTPDPDDKPARGGKSMKKSKKGRGLPSLKSATQRTNNTTD